MYDFIDVNRYLEISDIYIKNNSDLPKLRDMKNKSIVFCHDASVANNILFPELKKLKQEILLITVRDIEVCEQKTDNMPNNVLGWFGNNVTSLSQRAFGIPIGLPPLNVSFNPFDGYAGEEKRQILKQTINDNYKTSNTLAYMSHSNHTNSRRSFVFNFLKNMKWVKSAAGTKRINYKTYIEDVKKHRYTISPVGAGIDCHRTWESLYLGRTPVVEDSAAFRFFKDLPIMFIEKFEDLTEQDLLKFEPKENNLELLKFKYWENKIRSFLSEN